MLTQVEISNYRGFKSFKMEGLSRVNLLVGMNNSGKTAVLEGLQLLASGGDPSALQQAAIRRGELVVRRNEGTPLVDVSHFFHQHQLAVNGHFSLAGNNGYNAVTVRVIAIGEDGSEAEAPPKAARRSPRFAIKIEGGRRRTPERRIYPLLREGGVLFEDPAPWRTHETESLGLWNLGVGSIEQGRDAPSRYIGTDLVDAMSLAEMLDRVAISGKESMLSDALHLLDEKLQYVRQLSGLTTLGFRGSKAGVVAKMSDLESPIPLGSLGEGMRRMLTLAAALATTTGAHLFIDEIDTGLHYSVMHKMWELVVKTAEVYEIQVFAATHSYDCVFGLAKLLKREPDLKRHVGLHRIEAGKQNSVLFEPEEILTAIRQDIEIR
ncbi:MAG: AAA family ATPase [Phycisphaerae bacterium]|nr:AAA family ATPase [Phycisphaerae bacterium]